MSCKLTGTDTFEVEVTLGGTYQPGCPEQGPTYACGGQPAEPAMVEDCEVTGLFGLRRVGDPMTGQTWETVNLLDNVDSKSAAYRQIIANIEAFVGIEAMEAAMLRAMDEAF